MMPRIEAQEKLDAVTQAALCHNIGFETELARQQVMERLERQATGADRAPPPKASADDLGAMGIGVKIEGDMPTIASMDDWLGNGAAGSPSGSAAVGEQERG